MFERIGRPGVVRWAIGAPVTLGFGAVLLVGYALLVILPNLPSLDAITDYRPKIPSRVYTADKVLIGEFGAEHRKFVPIGDIPAVMKNALLAIEEARFYAHGGVDFKGVLRAVLADLRGGSQESARVLDARNVFVMDSMTRDVVRFGTGAIAGQRLPRGDLADKIGTTSDAVDGRFAGNGGDLVAVAWMGYDDPKSLSAREFGVTVALPIWISYMRDALKGKPEFKLAVPAGLAQADGDWMYQEFTNLGAIRSLGIERDSSEHEPGEHEPVLPQKDLSYVN